ncbi:zf-HC2 domain-containing protein [Aeromicrobium sp.]|uniref:zf-HC2 domain-containing protein n=1 Tax=Aeromicrobium sp. TaxID=1871063 RepID=UPI0030C0FAA3
MTEKSTAGEAVETPAAQELDDPRLVELLHNGGSDAYATLYGRHAYVARRLATYLGTRDEANEVVTEAFARTLELMRSGSESDTSFRAHLLATIRQESQRRATRRLALAAEDDARSVIAPFGRLVGDSLGGSAVLAAYRSLPRHWRVVLWRLDVEGETPQDLAGELDLPLNEVSASIYRVRTALRLDYVQQRAKRDAPTSGNPCQETRAQLPALLRRTLSERDQVRVHAHLQTCSECMSFHLEPQRTSTGANGSPPTG